MQFLRSDGGNLGGNGGNNVVDANSIYLMLTLTFIIFVSVVVKCYLPFTLNVMRFFSVEGKYFRRSVFFRLLHINFCVLREDG